MSVKKSPRIPIGIVLLSFLALCSACSRHELIEYSPRITPEAFLESQPHWRIPVLSNGFILTQPSSTLIVYTAGLLTLGVGVYFLRVRRRERTRLWWGVGLLFSGLGALLAGTSYQAFGYEIKCAGRAFCTWTSWWEVGYLLCTVAGMNALLVAVACSCASGKARRAVFLFAAATTVLYLAVILAGAFIPVKFLVSFECLMMFSAPAVLLAFILTVHAFQKRQDSSLCALLFIWLVFVLVMAAYLLALGLDLTTFLWRRGLWFTENDVLHVGMILWVIFIGVTLPKTITDMPEDETRPLPGN